MECCLVGATRPACIGPGNSTTNSRVGPCTSTAPAVSCRCISCSDCAALCELMSSFVAIRVWLFCNLRVASCKLRILQNVTGCFGTFHLSAFTVPSPCVWQSYPHMTGGGGFASAASAEDAHTGPRMGAQTARERDATSPEGHAGWRRPAGESPPGNDPAPARDLTCRSSLRVPSVPRPLPGRFSGWSAKLPSHGARPPADLA